jgi:predicted dehydrogenase
MRREHGGGEFFEVAVHHFDLWSHFLEREILEISATSRSGVGDDEALAVTGRAANGVLVTTAVSGNTSPVNEIELFGEKGRLRLSCYHFDGLEFVSSSQASGSLRGRWGRISRFPAAFLGSLRANRLGGDWVASYRAEWRHFLDAIRRDTPAEPALEDGRRAVQLVLAALQSASLGRSVEVAQAPRHVTLAAPVSG